MSVPRLTVTGLSLILSLFLSPVSAVADHRPGHVDPRLQAMQQELAELQARVAGVQARQDAGWLDERRAEEVRGLIHEVLADADTRAALLDETLECTYDHGFVIRDNGQFLLKICSYAQFRYLFSHTPDAIDDDEAGFQTRRLALMFTGHIGSPKITYFLMPAVNRADGSMRAELMFLKYQIDDAWSVTAGQIKAPFGKEWQTSARVLPLLERSAIHSLFTSLYVQGVKLTHQGDHTRLALTAHNGSFGWNRDFDRDNTDFAVGARGEWKLAGDWKQLKDPHGWAGDPFAMLLGAAVQYDKGETGSGTVTPDIFKYTADVSLESDGWHFLGVYTARHIESNDSPGLLDADQQGVMIQGGVFLVPDKTDVYARYEWFDLEGVEYAPSTASTSMGSRNEIEQLTVGSNTFFHGHATKFSYDVVYRFEDEATFGRAQFMVSF